MATDIEQVTTALTEFNAVAAGLEQLKKTYQGVVFDVETSEGMEVAKAARQVLRVPRYEIERIRKSAKAPLLAIGKKLDAEAARITTEILAIETPIDQQVKAEEGRREAERLAAAQRELDRVSSINVRIGELRGAAPMVERYQFGSAEILEHIGDLGKVPVDDSFAEFKQQATDAKQATLSRLRELHAAALVKEAEAERIRLEREELAALRESARQREEAEAAQRAEVDRIAQKARDEETRRQQESLAAQQAELNRQAAEQRKAQEAETERLRVARETLEREQEAHRKAQEPPMADPPSKPLPSVQAGRRPTSGQILRVLADHFGTDTETANKWLVESWG